MDKPALFHDGSARGPAMEAGFPGNGPREPAAGGMDPGRARQQTVADQAGLICSAQQGNLDSFNQLVLLYQDMAYHQAYRMLGDSQSADDAVQEAFISAYRNLRSFRGGSFRAWLSRIVTNICYDELRRRRSRPISPFELQDSFGEEIESPEWAADNGDTPEEQLLRAELGATLERCLELLPLGHRAVLVMVDILGFEYAEAAGALGLPIGTVKSRLARARTQMRALLASADKH
jgi:RNA polymerase sigma-70 factor (ECF subfamily)